MVYRLQIAAIVLGVPAAVLLWAETQPPFYWMPSIVWL
jgi:hypothetical protein